MVEPIRLDLKCYRGSSFSRSFTFKDKATKQVIPLTGYTAAAEIRPALNSDTLTAAFAVTLVEAEGQITIALGPQTTAGILPGTYEWDLKVTDPDDDVTYYVAGKFILTGRVTE